MLSIALPKGRMGNAVYERFAALGCACPEMQEDSRKLAAALQRRGFSWNDIRPVLNEWGQEIDET